MCALGRTSKENICFAPSRVRSNGSQISCVSIRVWLNDSEPWTRFSRICVYLVAQVNRPTSLTCHYRLIDSSCISYSRGEMFQCASNFVDARGNSVINEYKKFCNFYFAVNGRRRFSNLFNSNEISIGQSNTYFIIFLRASEKSTYTWNL